MGGGSDECVAAGRALRCPLGVIVKVRIPTVTVGAATLRNRFMCVWQSQSDGQCERVGDVEVDDDLAEWCAGCLMTQQSM